MINKFFFLQETSESINRSEKSCENRLNDQNFTEKDDFGELPRPIKLEPDKEGVFIKNEFIPSQNFPELIEENSEEIIDEPSSSFSKVNQISYSPNLFII